MAVIKKKKQKKQNKTPNTASIGKDADTFFFFTEVIYKAVLVSDVQQSNPVICTYIFFSIMAYCRILNLVPCAIQQGIVRYGRAARCNLFYIW